MLSPHVARRRASELAFTVLLSDAVLQNVLRKEDSIVLESIVSTRETKSQ